MTNDTLRSGEVMAGVALAGLGTYIFLQARQWTYMDASGPGPGFFPAWYGAAIVALSLFLVVNKLRSQAATGGEPVEWRSIGRALAAWACFAVVGFLMERLGFAVAFGLLSLVLVRFIFSRSWPAAIATAVACPAAFALVFEWALDVPLPAGPWGF